MDHGFWAPRAPELSSQVAVFHPSMHGIGRTYEYLVRHPENAEDLVAVLYAEHNLAPLTEPLINAVLTCIATCYPSAEAQPSLPIIVRELRSIPLSNRSHDKVLKKLRSALTASGAPTVPERIRDYKAEDARLLLQRFTSISRFDRGVSPDARALNLEGLGDMVAADRTGCHAGRASKRGHKRSCRKD